MPRSRFGTTLPSSLFKIFQLTYLLLITSLFIHQNLILLPPAWIKASKFGEQTTLNFIRSLAARKATPLINYQLIKLTGTVIILFRQATISASLSGSYRWYEKRIKAHRFPIVTNWLSKYYALNNHFILLTCNALKNRAFNCENVVENLP
jgi:hypothetical protein